MCGASLSPSFLVLRRVLRSRQRGAMVFHLDVPLVHFGLPVGESFRHWLAAAKETLPRHPSVVVAAIAAARRLLRGLRRLGRRVGGVWLLAVHQPLDRLFDFLDAAPDEFLKLLDLLLDGPQFVTEGAALLPARVVALVDFPGSRVWG